MLIKIFVFGRKICRCYLCFAEYNLAFRESDSIIFSFGLQKNKLEIFERNALVANLKVNNFDVVFQMLKTFIFCS